MNTIIYTRVSTDEQASSGFSLPHQKEALIQHCKAKAWTIIEHFEEDFSAKTFDRPAFNKLLEFVKRNKKVVDLICFTRWDRFSRNLEEALRTIRILKGLGVDVQSIEHPIDLTISDNKMLLAVYLTSPEIENDKNSLRTKEGLRRAQTEGCWTGVAPFGYDNFRDDNAKSTLAINHKAVLVKEAFDEFAKGVYNMEELRKKLIPKGMTLQKQAFLNMMRNVTYTGKIYIKAWGKDESKIVSGLHPSIISVELFDKAQNIINGRKDSMLKIAKRNEEFPLRGYLICPRCKGNLTGSASKSRNGVKHFYYHCQNDCKERVRADEAHKQFAKYLRDLSTRGEVLNYYSVVSVSREFISL